MINDNAMDVELSIGHVLVNHSILIGITFVFNVTEINLRETEEVELFKMVHTYGVSRALFVTFCLSKNVALQFSSSSCFF